jgi:hypothetical protein
MPRGARWLRNLLAVTALALAPAAAEAGWLSVRNDTRGTLVVQEIVVVNNQARRGPQRQLFAGEIAVESVTGAGVKRFIVFDPKQPNVILLNEDVKYTGADQVFSIQVDPPAMAGLPPQYKLVPYKGPPPRAGAGTSMPAAPSTPGRGTTTPPPAPPRPPGG